MINNPPHYQFSNGAQVIDITENLSFNLGNVVKYVARAGRKTEDPAEDLAKAMFYLKREIERIEDQPALWTIDRIQSLLSKMWDERLPREFTWREWEDLVHVPPGVTVSDRDGDLYRRVHASNEFEMSYADTGVWGPVPDWLMYDQAGYAPFKEVVST